MREHILTPKSIFSYASVSQKIGVFGQTLIRRKSQEQTPFPEKKNAKEIDLILGPQTCKSNLT